MQELNKQLLKLKFYLHKTTVIALRRPKKRTNLILLQFQTGPHCLSAYVCPSQSKQWQPFNPSIHPLVMPLNLSAEVTSVLYGSQVGKYTSKLANERVMNGQYY